jgi:hypothetical protein
LYSAAPQSIPPVVIMLVETFRVRIARLRMGFSFCLFVFRRGSGHARSDAHIRISAVAIRAANSHGTGSVHRRLICLRVARNASGAFAVGFFLRLAH